MFKKGETTGGETIIACGVRVDGDFTSKGRVIIDGEVIGNVKTDDDIQIGDQAKIVANVSARSGIIAGEVKGNVKVKDRLDLTATAKIKGDITANILSIEAGALINGKCSIGEISAEKIAEKSKTNGNAKDEYHL